MPPPFMGGPYKNCFLEGLPDKELKNLRPHCRLVSAKLGDILFRADDSLVELYFPQGAVVSLVANFQDGHRVEVALIGLEGLVGIWGALGSSTNWHEAVVQSPGEMLKIQAKVFRAELSSSDALRGRLNRYMLFLLAQVSQAAACNRIHRLEQRLARWLLMIQDQVGVNNFHGTHEFLSYMLGSDRSDVTIASGILRDAKLISYARGKIKVLDRRGLEDASCECYRLIAKEFMRIRQKRD